MQSQQKKVKWSRGETASALEERTDTGITNVSVARMENCIADIYGNISRRPAFKIVPSTVSPYILAPGLAFNNCDMGVFSISRTEYIILAFNKLSIVGYYWVISNKKCVKTGSVEFGSIVGTGGAAAVTCAQYNNYMVVFGYNKPFVLRYDSASNSLNVEEFEFIGPWYAPSGTTTEQVSNANIPGLNFNLDKLGFVQYTYTENGQTTVYYTMDTGINGTAAQLASIKEAIPIGSIVQFPNMGAYMRVEGFHWNGAPTGRIPSMTVYPTDRIYMFGALLTPAVDEKVQDTTVKVEKGYVRLDAVNGYYPTTGAFSNQRLYIGGFKTTLSTATQNFIPGFVVGSQIGRYTDFKNDYNLANEPENIDMSSKFQEVVEYIVDFNGLKILTDAGEYLYNGGIVQQSANGAALSCEPITFNSLLLYLDNNLRYVRAMQYEFQQNVFNSSIINQLTAEDLIFNPVAFAKSYDKEHSTGNYLYCIAPRGTVSGMPLVTSPNIALCNFVPSSQNMIWGRWEGPRTQIQAAITDRTVIANGIDMDNQVYFLVSATGAVLEVPVGVEILSLAVLDYDNVLDFETSVSPNATQYQLRYGNTDVYITFPKTTVSIFDNGVWQWDDTLDNQGNFTKSLSGLTNPTVGFMINATLDSHPIDIGGKTKSVVKRISKAIMSVRNTEPGAITINNKTGYMNPTKDMISFYGVTGMKREITYKVTNIKGAKFHLESLLLNLEYGTLIS